MRLEAIRWAMGWAWGLGAWVLTQGGDGRAQCPSPAVLSSGSTCLLQTKNMDYYKREVSRARGGGGSRGAWAARDP